MKGKNEVVENGSGTKELVTVSNPVELLKLAVEQNLDVDKLEKLMELQERWDKRNAKKAFDTAMSEFQSACPTIKKTKNGGQTKSGKVAYKYAPLESIVEQVKDLIKAHGFSYGIQTVMTEKTVKVFCTVKHIAGHSEISDVELPLTTRTEIMSAPQVVAATVTFGKRYAFCNGFGIMTGDDDTDGIAHQNGGNAPKERVSFQEGTKPLNPAKKPENKAKSPFVLNGKPSTRQHYIDTLDFNCKKHGIDISRMVEDSEVNKDFVDMSDADVLKVGKFVFAEIKKLLKKND